MRPTTCVQGRVRLYHADCREMLASLEDNSVDSIVMDPPYVIESVLKRFGKDGSAPAKPGKDGLYARLSDKFVGKKWDTGEVIFSVEFWRECLRVLKPGGFVFAFGGTRTYHKLATAAEAGGFNIYDMFAWAFGTGFPRSHPQGDGWGTRVKPSLEPILLARKEHPGSIAANREKWGTGALNVDGCKIEVDGEPPRFPAGLLHDGVLAEVFPEGTARFFYSAKATKEDKNEGLTEANPHPTVKPTPLMRWLTRLITPEGGVVLDPFMGSGSTGKAALLEGFQFIGAEMDPETYPVAEARIAHAAGPKWTPEPKLKELEYDGY